MCENITKVRLGLPSRTVEYDGTDRTAVRILVDGVWYLILRVSSSRNRHEVKYGYGSAKSIHLGDYVSTTYYYEGGFYIEESFEPAGKCLEM